MKGITKHLLIEFSEKLCFFGPSNQTVCLRPNGLKQTVWLLGPTINKKKSDSESRLYPDWYNYLSLMYEMYIVNIRQEWPI